MGLLLSALTACTEAEPAPAAPPSPSAVRSPASSSSPKPPEVGPARPLGAARIVADDAKLVEALRGSDVFPTGEAAPTTSEAAVVRRRRPVGTGDVVWMPDANTYCLVSIREQGSDRQCFELAARRKPQGYVHVGRSSPHGVSDQAEPHEMWLTVSVVENSRGPFAFVGGTPKHATSVQEATVKFPSGRTMTFLTYEFPEAVSIPMDAEICNVGRAICFNAFKPSAEGA
ncbi:hypothetical protein [Streptomyces davaonensis]|nr:hypothetical protein [Streptomyces davaonensis]